ncbi:MAG TPA: class II fructose-bisphosphate aldolase [Gemmatimonadales bacterium]|jgi:fructose/tagatose bisphosphate aldolase|nr:class II fructose-bisphosphate aldolase [Gemmatimonadales bacterium]
MAADLARAAPGFGGAIRITGTRVEILNPAALESDQMDQLVFAAVFGSAAERDDARGLLWAIGQEVGARPASIHDLYVARGEGLCGGFTVPAINVRMMAYDTARAVFRAAKGCDGAAILLEIARSEIAYTDQRPAEYVAVMIGAALREGYHHPLFIQGDHCQVNVKKYQADAAAEIGEVKKLIAEEIASGFFNVDVDTSTLVDLSFPTLDEQQRANYERAAEITQFIRDREPAGITVSVGAEIGEVGQKNSTVDELNAFMQGFERTLDGLGTYAGISKISVQTGTSHGGVVLPDGSIADVKLDLVALEALSKVAREEYGLAGAVQHGASTLPSNAFGNFSRIETAEIHLATNFQNMIFDHPALPAELRQRMYRWLDENAQSERKSTDSDEQFYYKARKKAIGPFKRDVWSLPAAVRQQIGADLEKTFAFLFTQLQVTGTAQTVLRLVDAPRIGHGVLAHSGILAEDDPDAGE